MKLLQFEMKKLWRQRKLLWVFLIILLSISGLFVQNSLEQEQKADRALEKLEPLQSATYRIRDELDTLRRNDALDELQAMQLEYVREMGSALMYWEAAIDNKDWGTIPELEGDFLVSVQGYEEFGGEFLALTGVEREIAMEKNKWIREHNLPYEDEAYPVSPHLVVKKGIDFLLGIMGIAILVIFFGNSIIVEKEQRTWFSLKTQPISNWKLIISKYASLWIVMIIYFLVVLGISVIIPLLFGDHAWNRNYPQVVQSGDNFLVISTLHYVGRGIIFFICASIFAFSLTFLISKWIKNSFSLLLVTSFIIFTGFAVTESSLILQSPWNPFHYFHFSNLLNSLPSWTDWIYLLLAIFWGTILVSLVIWIPEKVIGRWRNNTVKDFISNGKTRNYPISVLNIGIFEWRKIKRQSLFIQVLLLLVLCITFSYYTISQQAVEKETTYLENLREFGYGHLISGLVSDTFAQLEAMLESAEAEGDDNLIFSYQFNMEQAEKGMKFWRELEFMQQAAIEGMEQGDWMPLYEYQLFENQLNNNHPLGHGDIMKTNYGQFTVDVSIAEKYWLMEHNVQPVFSGEYISTIYEHWQAHSIPHRRDEWREENRKVDNSGLFSLYLMYNQYLYLVPMIIFLFLLGGGLANERGKKATLQFLMTQPIAFKNIFAGKILTATVVSLLSGAGMIGLIVLMGSIFSRFGDWMYPVLHYNSDKAVHSPEYEGMVSAGHGFLFVPLGEILVQNSLLFLHIILFLIVLSLFLSIFFKRVLSLFTTTFIVGAGGYWLSNHFLTEQAHLSPFTYFDIPKITNGEIATILNNPAVNSQTGMITTLVTTITLILIGYLYSSYKNNRKQSERK